MPCGTPRLCGISTCFQVLSPSTGQVAHALLTRPPLARRRRGRGPCRTPRPFDLHVLGTPPAFILSQDQTLMFILRLAASYAAASSAAGFLFLYCFWVRGIPATASSEFPLALFRAFTDFQGCIAVHLPRFVCILHPAPFQGMPSASALPGRPFCLSRRQRN